MRLQDDILQSVKKAGHALSPEMLEAVEKVEEVALAEKNSDITSALSWLAKKQADYPVQVEEVGIRDLPQWRVNPESGNITHESGKFFSIIGVKVTGAADREVPSWSQPMLKQEECGISGVICKRIGGIKHYLWYAKFEPGNINRVQISPALQVTASNLARAHQGKKPRLAEYFEEGGKGRVLKTVEGVEDGGRFYKKTNRTIIVEVDDQENVPVTDDYIWLTLPQIKKLLLVDHVVNSLARNVCAVL
jgi:oxidase EvaA